MTYYFTGTGAEVGNNRIVTFRRGDATLDGVVSISDAIVSIQLNVGLLVPCPDLADPLCTSAFNIASVKHDCTPSDLGDKYDPGDTILILRKIVGIINQFPNTCASGGGGGPQSAVASSAVTNSSHSAITTVGSAIVPNNGTGSVPVTININDVQGLGGYTIQVNFDPAVIRIDSVTGGQAPFNGAPTANLNNPDKVIFTAAIPDLPGPTGSLIVAYLNFTALGSPGSETILDLSVRDMVNAVPDDVPSTAIDGTIVVTPVCNGQLATIIGTNGNDTLNGTSGNDIIHGRGGNDTIYGLDGNDALCGGPGDDYIEGGSGVDTLYGDDGNDIMYGDSGNDTLNGGPGDDTLQGVNGDDVLNGDDGYDTLGGGNYTNGDQCNGGAGITKVSKCESGTSIAFCTGQMATIVGTEAGEVIAGTLGNDVIVGLGGNDELNSGNGDDLICGGAGNDTIRGGDDSDTLLGESGDDTVYGGTGNDFLYGSDGYDTLDGEAGTADFCDVGAGPDPSPSGCELFP
jgi:Ca2+-binding RTX toxin-like protein